MYPGSNDQRGNSGYRRDDGFPPPFYDNRNWPHRGRGERPDPAFRDLRERELRERERDIRFRSKREWPPSGNRMDYRGFMSPREEAGIIHSPKRRKLSRNGREDLEPGELDAVSGSPYHKAKQGAQVIGRQYSPGTYSPSSTSFRSPPHTPSSYAPPPPTYRAPSPPPRNASPPPRSPGSPRSPMQLSPGRSPPPKDRPPYPPRSDYDTRYGAPDREPYFRERSLSREDYRIDPRADRGYPYNDRGYYMAPSQQRDIRGPTSGGSPSLLPIPSPSPGSSYRYRTDYYQGQPLSSSRGYPGPPYYEGREPYDRERARDYERDAMYDRERRDRERDRERDYRDWDREYYRDRERDREREKRDMDLEREREREFYRQRSDYDDSRGDNGIMSMNISPPQTTFNDTPQPSIYTQPSVTQSTFDRERDRERDYRDREKFRLRDTKEEDKADKDGYDLRGSKSLTQSDASRLKASGYIGKLEDTIPEFNKSAELKDSSYLTASSIGIENEAPKRSRVGWGQGIAALQRKSQPDEAPVASTPAPTDPIPVAPASDLSVSAPIITPTSSSTPSGPIFTALSLSAPTEPANDQPSPPSFISFPLPADVIRNSYSEASKSPRDPRVNPLLATPTLAETAPVDPRITKPTSLLPNPRASNVPSEPAPFQVTPQTEASSADIPAPVPVVEETQEKEEKEEEEKKEETQEVKEEEFDEALAAAYQPRFPTKEELLLLLEKTDFELQKIGTDINNSKKSLKKLQDQALAKKQGKSLLKITPENLVQSIYDENKDRVTQASEEFTVFQTLVPPPAVTIDVRELPGYQANIDSHIKFKSTLGSVLKKRKDQLVKKQKDLSAQYKKLRDAWEKKIRTMEEDRERRKLEEKGPRNRPSLRTALSSPRSGSTTPRGSSRRSLLGSSDAVRSEAEFAQIMSQLKDLDNQDPNSRFFSALAEIPPMILDPKERAIKFIDETNLVVDSMALERERKAAAAALWSEDDKDMFIKRYLQYPKRFKKIASFLENKTTEDVIAFYYSNKKTLNIKKLLRQHQLKKRGTGRKTSTALYTELGLPRELAGLGVPETSAYWGNMGERSSRRATTAMLSPAPSQPQRRASSSRDLRDSSDLDEDYIEYEEEIKIDVDVKQPTTPQQQQTVPQQTPSQEQLKPQPQTPVQSLPQPPQRTNSTDTKWTDGERKLFVEGLAKHGKDWKVLSEIIVTKTQLQCRTHYNNFKKKLNFERIVRKFEQNNNNNNTTITATTTTTTTTTTATTTTTTATPTTTSAPETPATPVTPATKGKRRSKQNTLTVITTATTSSPASTPTSQENIITAAPALTSGDATPAATKTESTSKSDDDIDPNEELSANITTTWTAMEKQDFIKYLAIYGKNWKALSLYITTKTQAQIKSYFQTHKVKLNLGDLLESTKDAREAGERKRKLADAAREVNAQRNRHLAAAIAGAEPSSPSSPIEHRPKKRGRRARAEGDVSVPSPSTTTAPSTPTPSTPTPATTPTTLSSPPGGPGSRGGRRKGVAATTVSHADKALSQPSTPTSAPNTPKQTPRTPTSILPAGFVVDNVKIEPPTTPTVTRTLKTEGVQSSTPKGKVAKTDTTKITTDKQDTVKPATTADDSLFFAQILAMGFGATNNTATTATTNNQDTSLPTPVKPETATTENYPTQPHPETPPPPPFSPTQPPFSPTQPPFSPTQPAFSPTPQPPEEEEEEARSMDVDPTISTTLTTTIPIALPTDSIAPATLTTTESTATTIEHIPTLTTAEPAPSLATTEPSTGSTTTLTATEPSPDSTTTTEPSTDSTTPTTEEPTTITATTLITEEPTAVTTELTQTPPVAQETVVDMTTEEISSIETVETTTTTTTTPTETTVLATKTDETPQPATPPPEPTVTDYTLHTLSTHTFTTQHTIDSLTSDITDVTMDTADDTTDRVDHPDTTSDQPVISELPISSTELPSPPTADVVTDRSDTYVQDLVDTTDLADLTDTTSSPQFEETYPTASTYSPPYSPSTPTEEDDVSPIKTTDGDDNMDIDDESPVGENAPIIVETRIDEPTSSQSSDYFITPQQEYTVYNDDDINLLEEYDAGALTNAAETSSETPLESAVAEQQPQAAPSPSDDVEGKSTTDDVAEEEIDVDGVDFVNYDNVIISAEETTNIDVAGLDDLVGADMSNLPTVTDDVISAYTDIATPTSGDEALSSSVMDAINDSAMIDELLRSTNYDVAQAVDDVITKHSNDVDMDISGDGLPPPSTANQSASEPEEGELGEDYVISGNTPPTTTTPTIQQTTTPTTQQQTNSDDVDNYNAYEYWPSDLPYKATDDGSGTNSYVNDDDITGGDAGGDMTNYDASAYYYYGDYYSNNYNYYGSSGYNGTYNGDYNTPNNNTHNSTHRTSNSTHNSTNSPHNQTNTTNSTHNSTNSTNSTTNNNNNTHNNNRKTK